jgi:hypothetical protein
MTGIEGMDPNMKRQYAAAYGPFVAGNYPVGSMITVPGTSRKVIWSFHPCDGRGLVYVVDDASGSPVEVQAAQVISKATPW